MFGKRCTLCGGKLNNNGICTECGLDNTKSDKNYKLNQSECDHEPLTHVHHEKPTVTRQQGQYSENKGRKMAGKKKSAGKIISKVIAVIVILNVIIGILQPLWDSILSDGIDNFTESNEDYTRSDTYKDLTEDLPPEGESVNPLKGGAAVTLKGDATVGADIPEGVYDVEVISGEGSIEIDIYLEDGDYNETLDLYLGENSTDGTKYQNLVLPKDAQITLDGDLKLRLTPSEKISTTDYLEYYNY